MWDAAAWSCAGFVHFTAGLAGDTIHSLGAAGGFKGAVSSSALVLNWPRAPLILLTLSFFSCLDWPKLWVTEASEDLVGTSAADTTPARKIAARAAMVVVISFLILASPVDLTLLVPLLKYNS